MNVVLILMVKLACIVSLSAQDDFETVQAVSGHSAELPCDVTVKTRDDQLLVLAWYRDGSNTAFYSYDRREGKRLPVPGGRYQLTGPEGEPRLVVQQVTPADKGGYQCTAEFARSPSRTTNVQLYVIEPPQRLWVGVQKTTTRVATASEGANASGNVGPYYVGDSVELYCVAFGGSPQATLTWWSGPLSKRLLTNATATLSPQRVRSDVTYGPLRREDHGLVLTCLGNNNDVTPPLAIDIVIDMKLPPELIAVRSLTADDGRVHSDATLALQCRVLGARPTPPIIWRVGDGTLVNLKPKDTEEPSQRLLVSEIELTIDHTWDEAQITCCVPAYKPAGGADYTCAPPLPLTVFYPPVVNITVEGGILEPENCTVRAVKGSDVTLNCTHQANPPATQLIWFHEDDILTDYESSNDTYQPVLELRGVTEKDKGVYVCYVVNSEDPTYSDPIYLDITYPAICKDETVAEYGLRVEESINITCNVKANPAPVKYGWVVVNEVAKADAFKNKIPDNIIETENSTFLYTRPNDTAFSSLFCWGINEVVGDGLPETPCSFLITDMTAPRPPTDCLAVRSGGDVTVTCEKGHDGGLPQRFTIVAKSTETEEILETITKLEPKFLLQDLTQDSLKLEIVATNDKGDSKLVEIDKDSIVDELTGGEAPVQNTVANITTLALALFGGVLLVALAACGLVLCAHERGSRPPPPPPRAPNPPLCAYNTDETNCNDSDDSECNVRRTESFRRAMARYPSKNFDVRRTSSFHSARYLHDMADTDSSHKHSDLIRHSPSCRVHSMQNIHRRRDMDNLCDHLATHLPPNTSTFHTMPKKLRNKMTREISDEASVVTTSDGFSLPPPPDEFGTYRSGTKIKDMPKTPTYTTIIRKNSSKKQSQREQQYGNISSPMNTVGIPTVSGTQGVYSYPDDECRQVLLRTPGVLTTFQTFSSPKESGI